MEIQPQRFRIKVIERNDGTKMYHPQVWVIVELKHIPKIVNRFWGNKKWEDDYNLIYDWRSIITGKDGYDTSVDNKDNGCGGNDIKYANEIIEQYKIDLKKRQDMNKEKEQEELNKKTKQITFIEIS